MRNQGGDTKTQVSYLHVQQRCYPQILNLPLIHRMADIVSPPSLRGTTKVPTDLEKEKQC